MLSVKFGNKSYTLFDNISVNTSLDNMVGTFTIDTTLQANIPFGLGDLIKIFADDVVIITGYIEKYDGNITVSTASQKLGGRTLLGDLVDSSVPVSLSSTVGGITLTELCQKVIKGLGISSKVINEVGFIEPFKDDEISAVGFGGKAGEFLQNFARKRQVFLTADGNGSLVLFRPPSSIFYTRKLTETSMINRSFSYSTVNRYGTIVVGSEDNFAAVDNTEYDKSVDRRSEFLDKQIRASRYLQLTSEESMSDSELEGKAQEEVNIRRARGFSFKCTVPSHEYIVGKLIKISDSLSQVDGTFLIKAIGYKTSVSGGDVSELELCFPDTYSGVGARTSENKSKMGVASEASTDATNVLTQGVGTVLLLDGQGTVLLPQGQS